MQKQAPTVGRLLTMVIFALSCFGLLLFLWLSFGGSVPLKPKGYRFNAAFPQAVQLAQQADVRVAGITVGKVVKKTLDPSRPNLTSVTMEIDPKYAPLRSDARAVLREKTLLGETFVELTLGSHNSKRVRDGGWLAASQVQPNVYLDQVIQAFDPGTREAFRNWQQYLAAGSAGHGQDINDSFGNLPQFAMDATSLLQVLNDQSGALSQLISNTGVVFGALSRNTAQLHNVIVNSGAVFQTTADQQNALAQVFKDFPAFIRQSKSTLAKLQTFSLNTDPLVRNLRPVARDLRPTLADVRAFAPDLRNTFINLDPLITASRTGLPALRDTLNGLTPVLGALDPFLAQLNPILQFIELYQAQTSMFLGNPGSALAATQAQPAGNGQVGHYLRVFGPTGAETLATFAQRPATDRGNTYVGPNSLQGELLTKNLVAFPSFDCNNTGGEHGPTAGNPAQPGQPGCTLDRPINFQGALQKYPHVQANNYDKQP